MNNQYTNQVNANNKCLKKIKNNVKHWWNSKRTPIIQIGVGGYIGCGKTVLIDAMFAALDSSGPGNPDYPDYLPEIFVNSKSIDCRNDIFQGKFRDYSSIRSFVSSYFHDYDKLKTDKEEGTEFGSNTYWLNLKYKSRKCVFLIRNLPGEMFNQYYNASFFDITKKKSLDEVFDDFIKNPENKYKNTYKHFFDFFSYGEQSEAEILELKKSFKQYLTQQYPYITGHDNYNDCMDDFYAYIFYKSSDTVIRCVRAVIEENSATEKQVNRYMIESAGNKQNDYLCITQFDRILIDKNSIKFGENRRNNWKKYAQKMSEIYDDIKNEKFSIIEKDKWKNNKPQKLHQTTPYISSVAFHFEDDKFLGFKNDIDTDKWTDGNSQYRTSLGVIELVLNILKKHKVKISIENLENENDINIGSFIDRL